MDPRGGSADATPPLPGDPTPYESDWNHEFLAGWIDGFGCAKARVLAGARAELFRYGLTVDAEGLVEDPVSGRVPLERAAAFERDNPDGHPAYDQGWDRGYDEGHQEILRRVRVQLGEYDLFLADDGCVATSQVVSELLRCVRGPAGPAQPPHLTDAAIHAFIDGLPTPESFVPGEATDPVADPCSRNSEDVADCRSRTSVSLGLWLLGVWNMVRRHVDRRTAVVALGSVLATVTVQRWSHRASLPGEQVKSQGQEVADYVAPTTWDGYPITLRNWYLSWDQLVWQLERDHQESIIESKIAAVMQLNGQSELKALVAGYVSDTQKARYLPQVLLGLDPAATDLSARRAVLGAVDQTVARSGTAVVPSIVRTGLLQYEAMGVETDPQMQAMLARILADLSN